MFWQRLEETPLIRMLNWGVALMTQSCVEGTKPTSINRPASFRQGVWKWVGMWDCVAMWGRRAGWGWSGWSRRGCGSSRRGGGVRTGGAGARTWAWAPLGVVRGVSPTPAWQRAVSFRGWDARLGPCSRGQRGSGRRRRRWGGAIAAAQAVVRWGAAWSPLCSLPLPVHLSLALW